jgi:hypothetical protein
MKKRIVRRRVRRNSETRAELQWEWACFDPTEIGGVDDVEDWMAGGGTKKR